MRTVIVGRKGTELIKKSVIMFAEETSTTGKFCDYKADLKKSVIGTACNRAVKEVVSRQIFCISD